MVCCFLLLAMEATPSLTMMYVMVILQGVGYGLATVFGSMPADVFQGKGYGVIFGTISTMALVGGAVGPWITGLLYDNSENYHWLFTLL